MPRGGLRIPQHPKPCRECGKVFLPTHGSQVRCSTWCCFWSKVDVGDCWVWTGSRNPNGYGGIRVAGVRRLTHIWLWNQLVGPVPDGLELDHLCRNRACVNPDHLEPVTHKENMNRGLAGFWQRSQTTCIWGHEFSKANHADGRKRVCRTCALDRSRAQKRRQREEAQHGRRAS